MKRKKIVAGNWKMNLTSEGAVSLASEVFTLDTFLSENVSIIISPSFVFLNQILSLKNNSERISIAAQDCSQFENGAFTGEVSAKMLSGMGVKYVILGHSERRKYFSETNNVIAQKINLCLKENISPIFCCGESADERKAGKHFETVKNQIQESLFQLSETDFQKVIIAYEPVWAIGTGVNATPDQAQEMHAFIRKIITEKFGKSNSEKCSILYGGSCNSSNAKEIFCKPDVDGGLIGGASLKISEFREIIEAAIS